MKCIISRQLNNCETPYFQNLVVQYNDIISRVLWSRWYLSAVFWHLMYHYERQAAKACPALISLYYTTVGSENRVSQTPNSDSNRKEQTNEAIHYNQGCKGAQFKEH